MYVEPKVCSAAKISMKIPSFNGGILLNFMLSLSRVYATSYYVQPTKPTKLLECYSCGTYPGWKPSILAQVLRIARAEESQHILQNNSLKIINEGGGAICNLDDVEMSQSWARKRRRRDISNYPTTDTTACVGHCAKIVFKNNLDHWVIAKNCLAQCEETEDEEVKLYCCSDKDKCNRSSSNTSGHLLILHIFCFTYFRYMSIDNFL